MNDYYVPKNADAREINSVLDAAITVGGGRVYVPAGRYEVNEPIVVQYGYQPTPDEPPPTIELCGDGIGATTITAGKNMRPGAPLLMINRSFTYVHDLQLFGRDASGSWRDVLGIMVQGGESDAAALRRVSIERVAVRDTRQALSIAPRGIVILLDCSNCLFAVTTHQVAIARGGAAMRFRNCSFTEFGIDVELYASRGTSFVGCHWEGNRGSHPYLMLSDTRQVSVRDAWFEESHLAENEGSPWFAFMQNGCQVTDIAGVFVRKNPKLRLLTVGHGSACQVTSVDAHCKVVGPWDEKPAIWCKNRSTVWAVGLVEHEKGTSPIMPMDI